MEKIIDLRDLLQHQVMDLYSAEEQIIAALPKMIEKAGNRELKNALSNHLRVTEEQKNRLDEIQRILPPSQNTEETGDQGEMKGERRTGFFARLFGGSSSGSGGEKCRGVEGLIEEGEKMMAEDMTPEAADAAIISSAQKIEHYEISGYGTARAYARELNLGEVANLLEQTLNEEYEADDQLTSLAVGKLNLKAEMAEGGFGSKSSGGSKASRGGASKASRGGSSSGGSKASKDGSKGSKGSKGSNKSASKSSGGSKAARGGASKASRGGGSKASKGGSKSAGGSSKRGSSKGSKSARGSLRTIKGSRGGSKAIQQDRSVFSVFYP